MPVTISTETQLALLNERQMATDRKVEEMEGELSAMRLERDRALKWGVMALGSAVMGMAYWIFNKITSGHIS